MKETYSRPKILVLEALSGSANCVTSAGGQAITVSPRSPASVVRALRAGVDGVLLTGGSDVNPARYGQKKHPEVYGVDPIRDGIEILVLACARSMDIPVLGICRGMQIMNVEAGGTLNQDIGRKHWGVTHPIRTEPKSVLRDVVGRRPMVKSFHHQEVAEVGAQFQVVARAPDKRQTIEAIEDYDGRSIGVQFHPEMMSAAAHSRALFKWLVIEASASHDYHNAAPNNHLASLQLIADAMADATPIVKKAKVVSVAEEAPSLYCVRCGLQFDDVADRLDHEAVLHA